MLYRFLALVALCTLSAAPAAIASDAESIAIHRHQKAIEALGQSRGDEALRRFADEHLTAAYRDSFAPGRLMELLGSIRRAAANAGGVLFGHDDGASIVRFVNESGETAVAFRTQSSVPYLIESLEVTSGEGDRAQVAPIGWDTLESRLDEEADAGFSGAVCVVRDGEVVLSRGYGFASREKQVPNSERTIFAIGSVPIAFTHAAVLKLADMEKLEASDPITKFLPDVPADKRTITIDHLLSGRSGLADFHHVPGVDADPDLSWIDRATAVTRILGGELRFAPGSDHAHSHSAWVLLAAVVEIVSGESYGEFLRRHLFEPAGMTRTHLHEGLSGVPDDQIAVGYEAQRFGPINSPKYWGRTSWLVMGSGGMSSTPEDLRRFFTAVRGAGGMVVGGDDRGFLCMHARHGGDMFILCSNAHSGPGDHPFALGMRLAEMIER